MTLFCICIWFEEVTLARSWPFASASSGPACISVCFSKCICICDLICICISSNNLGQVMALPARAVGQACAAIHSMAGELEPHLSRSFSKPQKFFFFKIQRNAREERTKNCRGSAKLIGKKENRWPTAALVTHLKVILKTTKVFTKPKKCKRGKKIVASQQN